MNKVGKKLIAGVLTISMLALTACGGGNTGSGSDTTEDKKTGKEATDGAKGRYLEEKISLPEEAVGVKKIQLLDGGIIRVISYSGIYDSADNGKTFTYIEESKAICDGYSIESADCSSSGEMVIRRMMETEDSYSTEYIHVDANFNVTPLEINIPNIVLNKTEVNSASDKPASDKESGGGELTTGGEAEDSITSEGTPDTVMEAEGTQNTSDTVTGINILPNENYLVYTSEGDIYQVDKSTGEVVTTYSSGEYNNGGSYAIIDNQLIVFMGESVSSYDFESGKVSDTDAVLTDLMSSGEDDIMRDSIRIAQDDESLYYVNKTGIHRYKLGTGETEEIANADLNSLSNPEYFFTDVIKTDNNEFYVAASNMWGTTKILKYTYSADMLTTPSQEVKIYALKDNDSIRQAISVYQNNNPDVYASLEIGMPEGSSATAADAIRTLNTNIVAGTGPDILILDGLPIDSYIEKNSLIDLSDVIAEVSKGDSFFENIVNTYKKDGSVYAVPTKFSVDLLVANKDILSSYGDLNGLADKAEAYKASAEGNVINLTTAKNLVTRLYDTSAGVWGNEDGTLDKKILTEFITALEKIYKTIDKDTDSENGMMTTSGDGFMDTAIYVSEALYSNYPMSVVPFASIRSLIYLTCLAKHIDNADYTLLNGQAAKSYVPISTVGISAKSKNQGAAKELIKTLLSAEIQSSNINEGIPVNKTAYDSSAVLPKEVENEMGSTAPFEKKNGTVVEIGFVWPEKEVFESLKKTFESLEVASNTNSIVKEAVIEETVLGLEAGTSVDEIVAKILTKVNLYLSE